MARAAVMFMARVAAWPVRVALLLIGALCAVGAVGAFMEFGAAWQPVALVLAAAACWEGRRALS